jgi:hypothetical protein
MKARRNRQSFFLAPLVVSVFFIGCEKDIKLELQQGGNKTVLFAFIYPDSALNVHLSKSVDILSTDNYQYVESGRLKLSVNKGTTKYFSFPGDQTWGQWSSIDFKAGDQIDLIASGRNIDTALVTTYIPEVINVERIDTISSKYKGSDGDIQDVLKCNIGFIDPPSLGDKYQLMVIQERWEVVNEVPYYYREIVPYIQDDQVFYKSQEGSLLEGLDLQGLFTDDQINGQNYSVQCLIPKNYYEMFWFDEKIKLTFYLYHHTNDYYEYYKSKLTSDYYNDLPIFEPVTIHSNVINGVGLVSGLSFSNDSILFVAE